MAKSAGLVLLAALLAGAVAQGTVPEMPQALVAAPQGPVVFFEGFRQGWNKAWTNSTDDKYNGEWQYAMDYSEIKGDAGLKMASPGKLHAIAAKFVGDLTFKDKPVVIQYEVKATNGLACDGMYLKLLQDVKGGLDKFNNDARYTIMFGPDKCSSTDKVHFIVQYQNPVSKEWEEKHAKEVPFVAGSDRQTHLYTLIIRPDNTFEIKVDGESKTKGSLLESMQPPINPPKEIDDPKDSKPSDWVDEAMIDDPDAKKPDDWDEDAPEMIEDDEAVKPAAWEDDEPQEVPDPKAKKPSDWDDEEDGDWEAPIVPNPKCKEAGCGEWKRPMKRNPDFKGKWFPARISNPKYKGEWKPRQIPNKNYFEESDPFSKLTPISAVAVELLSISGGIVFDNILVANSEETASDFAAKTWGERSKLEKSKLPSGPDLTSKVASFFSKNAEMAVTLFNQHPAAFLAGVGLALAVVIFLIIICCRASSSTPPVNRAKKQDLTEEDDDDESISSSEDENESPAAATRKPASKPAAKRSSRKD
eukprot:CAMPEP_0173439532 /NCGR_PEP_ID=MMETSP1357-20121228/21102_1 /TAXON_ID=77926 /ORGANISM="Hemiselmis rufescens, Strain PCC563" /LENGTH=529 /DNA_ID=CAMNT_0014404915 /DNA_START=13 /DNA_END=1602 /DNA_ORIENTATION=+